MSPMKWFLCFLLALTFSCADMEPSSVDISIKRIGVDFEILVSNNSGEMITFSDHLFGGLRDPQFIIEVRDSAGMSVELCGSIDMLPTPKIIELPTGSSTKLPFYMSFVVSSYCLKIGEHYEFRIGFASKNGETDYSKWTPFSAVFDGYTKD